MCTLPLNFRAKMRGMRCMEYFQKLYEALYAFKISLKTEVRYCDTNVRMYRVSQKLQMDFKIQ